MTHTGISNSICAHHIWQEKKLLIIVNKTLDKKRHVQGSCKD